MEVDDPVSLNLYLYGKGNPLRYVDPSGNVCIEEHAYLKQTVRHVILGNYTDDVTMAGVGIDVLLGIVGLDLPMDIRDISADFSVNFNPTELSWWGMTFVDCIGVLPLIGSLKYVDELGALGKNAVKGVSKHWDEAWDGLKHSDDIWEGLAAVFKIGRKNSDEAVRGIREVIEATNKKLDELDEAVEAAGKRLDGVDKIDELENVVEGGTDILNNLKPQNLMDELASSGVKYNPDEVIAVTKAADGKLLWLEQGDTKSGLIHILERHADDFASQSIDDIPQLLNDVLKNAPIKTGSNSKGLFADYVFNGNTYRVAYGTNGYIVSFYPID